MRTRRYIPGKMLLLLMAAAMLGGCTKEELGGGDPLPEGKYPLEFTTQMYGMDVTRATSGNTWDGGEQIAIRVGSGTRKYTVSDKNTGKITSAAGVVPFYWTSTTETKTVSAYYPFALASASEITVNSAQNIPANYQVSDALYAAPTSIAFAATEKKLTFKHLPAKVVAHLKAGDGVTNMEVQGATVKFVSQSLTAPFDNATGVVTAASVGSSSVVSNVLSTPAYGFAKSVQALLVPCQMKGNKFIEVTTVKGDKFYYTPTSDTDGKLESGKVCTYEITVKRDDIEVVLKESNAWGDGGSEDVQSRSLKMQFTIDLTSYSDKTYILPFKTSGSIESYTLIVNWGDGSGATTINPGTTLSSAISHTYANAQEYTITISTTEEDFSKEQIPGFKPGSYQTSSSNKLKLKSLLTPLLNTGEASFASCFSGCTNLTGSIPAGLFDNNPQVTTFTRCFYNCNNLTGSIPTGLFDNHPLVTTFSYCFSSCNNLTGSIPTGLFDNNPQVTTFLNCFNNCQGLTGSIPTGLFANNPLVITFSDCFFNCNNLTGSIPTGLFDNNPQVTTFFNCFYNCQGLTGSIPAGLFDNNSKVTDFSSCFSSCNNLTGSIPTGLFDNNPQVTTFLNCFNNCQGLTGSIPAGLFANNPLVTTFSYCFYKCSKLTMNSNIFCDEAAEKTTRFAGKTVTFLRCFTSVGADPSVSSSAGTAPALWDGYAGTFTSTECFQSIGTVTNASSIPNAWKQ